MPETTGYGNIDTFDIVQVIGNLISDNVTDIRTNRKNPRWVFPTFPDDDVNYPEIVVELKSVSYDDISAGRFFKEEVEESTGDYLQYYTRYGVAEVRITVLTEKKTPYEVVRNGTTLYLTNQPLNLYLCNSISDALKWKRDDLLQYFIDFRVMKKSPVFEDDSNTWASEIDCEVEYQDIWVKRYDASGELVDEYSLIVNIIDE
jgi:uncharacterized protein YneR